ncbi:hypothetical protein BH20ACI1_BH20ACI1_25200 [soil metagenome]
MCYSCYSYKAAPDGLGGNDDCEQMSAWFLFSSLGFYPVAPASDEYQIGSPAIKSAVLNLENGKTLTIEAANQSDKNVYVQKVVVNGKEINHNYLTSAEIMNGGKITFYMSEKPSNYKTKNEI